MRPKVKYAVIYRQRNEYPVFVMCEFFEVSRSGYYDFVKPIGKPEQDTELANEIRICQRSTNRTYGYRRVWLWLEQRKIHRNPKTVFRAMKKYGLLSEIRRRRKWVNLGQQIHRYDNLLKRQFRADRLNTKWVTDISYIHTKEGVLYLSMIRDLYDNSIVAYKTASRSISANSKSCTGYNPVGYEEGEKENRCGVAAPQRPGVSIHFSRVF